MIETGQYGVHHFSACVNVDEGIEGPFQIDEVGARGQHKSVCKKRGPTHSQFVLLVEVNGHDVYAAAGTLGVQGDPDPETADDARQDRCQNRVLDFQDSWLNQAGRKREYGHSIGGVQDELPADTEPSEQDQGDIQQEVQQARVQLGNEVVQNEGYPDDSAAQQLFRDEDPVETDGKDATSGSEEEKAREDPLPSDRRLSRIGKSRWGLTLHFAHYFLSQR